jgi:uncharacterized protein YcbK (DUF882 family)
MFPPVLSLEPSKKELAVKEKRERKDVRALKPPRSAPPEKVLSLRNMWTDEIVPVIGAGAVAQKQFDSLVRCHHTNQAIEMDQRLLDVMRRAATRFGKTTVYIISGFRAPKYQLMLRKKGHEVARDSEHPRGQAIDFRLPEVPTKTLLKFVRSLHLGGVGYYPESRFVHADVGRVRFWRGR